MYLRDSRKVYPLIASFQAFAIFLVTVPKEGAWSSYHYYQTGVQGTVAIDQGWGPATMTRRPVPEDLPLPKEGKDRPPGRVRSRCAFAHLDLQWKYCLPCIACGLGGMN